MRSRAFSLHVAQLRRVPGTEWHERIAVAVSLEDLIPRPSLTESVIPDGEEVTCDVTLQSFQGGVQVGGTLTAPWTGFCRRCTAPVSGTISAGLRERFIEPGTDGVDDNDEAYPIADDELDLWPMVHDALLLELPASPLCRPDCLGLCPQCGNDQNEHRCSCEMPSDSRWASLDVLRSAHDLVDAQSGRIMDSPKERAHHGRSQEEDIEGKGS